MNLQRLWCVLVIIAFSMPLFAITPPYQIDSFDDFNNVGGPNWVEVGGQAGWGSYIEQQVGGTPNEVNEGTGSMKIDFTQYSSPARRCETFRTYDPNLDCNNYEELAITLWVWTDDVNDSRRGSLDSRLTYIVLTDSSFGSYEPWTSPYPDYVGNMGRFAVPPLPDLGWNKVIAPLRNFRWIKDPIDGAGKGTNVDPNTEVDWNDINDIGLWARTEIGDHNAIYIDDMWWELAPDPCSRPYRLASFDNIRDELWSESHRGPGSAQYMLQNPPGDANYIDSIDFYDFALYVGNYIGDINNFAGLTDIWLEEVGANNEYNLFTAANAGSMLIDWETNPDGVGTETGDSLWDLTPTMPLIPALDFADGNDWAITMWVWGEIYGEYGSIWGTSISNDSWLWEIVLHDAGGNRGYYRVPRQDWDAGTGWTKVTARIDEFLWEDTTGASSFANITASQANLEAIIALELWVMDYPHHGNDIYLDDLWIEPAVEAISEAVVYDADYTPVPLTIDGDATDWAGLVDSDIIDFDLADPNIKGQPTGNLHVQYRLAWDPNYLYILVEEQPGDDLAFEATHTGNSSGGLAWGTTNTAGIRYDSLALSFDFTNNRLPSVDVHMSLYLILGLSSDDRTDLFIAYGDPAKNIARRWETYNDLIANGDAKTAGTWTSSTVTTRVIEARLKWTDLESKISSWHQPDPNLLDAVEAGFIFGCDPHLQDRDNTSTAYTTEHGLGWFSGRDNIIQWAQGNFRWPTGRDKYSTDIRLVNP